MPSSLAILYLSYHYNLSVLQKNDNKPEKKDKQQVKFTKNTIKNIHRIVAVGLLMKMKQQ